MDESVLKAKFRKPDTGNDYDTNSETAMKLKS
jgi:hypothetical protein